MARTETANGKQSTPDASDLADQIATLKSDLATLTEMMSEMGSAEGERARETVRNKVASARDTGAAQLADAKAQAQHLGAEANDFMTRQPAAALGIAAGIGFLVGMFGARK